MLFATGYGSPCSEGYEDVPVLPKPYRQDRLMALLERLIC
jgi:hypothetical protein